MARPIDVTVLFLEASHASTSVGPLEVFRAAGALWNQLVGETPKPAFRVRTASIRGRPVRADGPYALAAEEAIESVRATDLVFVPSAGLDVDAALGRNGPVIDFIRDAYARGTRIAGVCSGVALLAAAGILDDKAATTHWALVESYRRRFPAVDFRPESLVTEDDGVYCGGGVHAALDLALYLVEKLCDRTVALHCARALLVDMPRASQSGFAVLPVGRRHGDAAIRRAEDWIHGHCREEFSFESLARELGMSPRNFIRRFKAATGFAPVDYLQRLRIGAARRLLEEDTIGVQEVCGAVGYGDAAFFRRLFRRHTGLAPGAYRKRFGGSVPA